MNTTSRTAMKVMHTSPTIMAEAEQFYNKILSESSPDNWQEFVLEFCGMEYKLRMAVRRLLFYRLSAEEFRKYKFPPEGDFVYVPDSDTDFD